MASFSVWQRACQPVRDPREGAQGGKNGEHDSADGVAGDHRQPPVKAVGERATRQAEDHLHGQLDGADWQRGLSAGIGIPRLYCAVPGLAAPRRPFKLPSAAATKVPRPWTVRISPRFRSNAVDLRIVS